MGSTPTVGSNFMPSRYNEIWVEPDGATYRQDTYDRQSKAGSKPLLTNPTVDEVKFFLRVHGAKTVLEVGCGWGRLMEQLQDEFNVFGCDVSDDLIRLAHRQMNIIKLDIVKDLVDPLKPFDIVFTRGVMCYIDDPEDMLLAMQNMAKLATHKVLIWEHLAVCARMDALWNSNKFEYHPIRCIDE